MIKKTRELTKMSSRYLVQNPISAGQFIACYNATSTANTDWNSLTSSDFYDPTTGTQLPAGLEFAFVGVSTDNTSTLSYFKLRAAGGTGDPILNTSGVIAFQSSYSVDSQALAGSSITSIAFKKAASGDQLLLQCGFNRG